MDLLRKGVSRSKNYSLSAVKNILFLSGLTGPDFDPSCQYERHLCSSAAVQRFVTEKNVSKPFSKMAHEPGDLEFAISDEFLERRESVVEDEQIVIGLLKDIIDLKDKNVSSWLVENKIKNLFCFYRNILKPHKFSLIKELSSKYAVDHDKVKEIATLLAGEESEVKKQKYEEELKTLLTPQYTWLFRHIGRLENGVKFLVDLRTDILDLLLETDPSLPEHSKLQQLNVTLKEILSLWFSVGFLKLERVTWKSSCEMLQKISEYEAVHPVRSWTDLKRRVGLYRRCFVFLHSSMPGEPLVVLHTALCDEIAASTKGIVAARSRMSVDVGANESLFFDSLSEDPTNVRTAVFYSITSTQRGLQGIELGNYLIKSVVTELQVEFPNMVEFSSLSPIPNFKSWLLEKLRSAERGQRDILTPDEIEALNQYLGRDGMWKELRRLLKSNTWIDDRTLSDLLQNILMRLCSRYLYLEKRRGFTLDSVANFHLRNGAVMWRINWGADLSPRGLTNSAGIMVNYRYFLQDTETNSRNYLEHQTVKASDGVLSFVEQARQLIVTSKM